MKADGKLLFELGCPPKKIKFFVGKEFDSIESIKAAFAETKEVERTEWDKNCAYIVLQELRDDEFGIPPMTIRDKCEKVSNGELKRWLEQKAVIVNGEAVMPETIINFPIISLVFFPNGKRKTTLC